MLKLWKALYYSLWLADSGSQSDELAESLASVIPQLKERSLLLYVRCLYQTVLREWSSLDQHRIKKIYFLLRVATNRVFRVILLILSSSVKKLKASIVPSLISILWEEVMTKTPNGVRNHLADIFLPELVGAVKYVQEEHPGVEVLGTEGFLALVRPFLDVLGGKAGGDEAFRSRICRSVFRTFLATYARENQPSEPEASLFAAVESQALQREVFEAAAAPDTPSSCREGLYQLHRELAAKTGVAFASKPADEATDKGPGEEVKVTKATDKGLGEETKVTKATDKGPGEEIKVTKAKGLKEPKGKDKRPREEEKAPRDEDKDTEKGPKEVQGDKGPGEDPLKKARKAEAPPEQQAGFIQCGAFSGSRPGYVFQKGPQGLGYYRDLPPAPSALKQPRDRQPKKKGVRF